MYLHVYVHMHMFHGTYVGIRVWFSPLLCGFQVLSSLLFLAEAHLFSEPSCPPLGFQSLTQCFITQDVLYRCGLNMSYQIHMLRFSMPGDFTVEVHIYNPVYMNLRIK